MKSKNNERITEKDVIRPLLVGLKGSTSTYHETDGPVSKVVGAPVVDEVVVERAKFG